MKNYKKIVSTLLLFIILLNTSCSTILQGSKQNITIKSLTPGAKINVDGDDLGNDLVAIKLKRNTNHTIMIRKEGYQTKTITLERRLQAGFVVIDVLLALTGVGLIWIIVDAATGSWHTFDKEKIVVELDAIK
jgi:hypothetical protein